MRKILLGILLLAACNSSVQRQDATVAFTDDYNRTVQVPKAPQRVVSTSPAVTEIIYALGGGDILVGRTDFCSYPPEALQIESIGGISNLNVEKIVSLNPDIVIERFAGEVPPRYLVSEPWMKLRYDEVLARIEKRMEERDTWQGRLYQDANHDM